MLLSGNQIFQVNEITQLIKKSLEQDFQDVSVEGEISNFKAASSGHCYFSLKDKDALLSAVLFRGSAMKLNFRPSDGQKVVAKGRISVYPQRGSYQLVCQSLKQAGQGDLLQLIEERKQKLALEGWFDQEKKKPLPYLPRRVAVVTSPTGAAVRDILQILERRNPGLSVCVLPAAVQGERAAHEIASQIERANLFNLGDLIIAGRGGGSLEDLMAFNEEVVVRAIGNSQLPVVSAVGHEIDVSLSDFAADLRAPTPSAAAELVTPHVDDLQRQVQTQKESIIANLENRLKEIRNQLDYFKADNLRQQFNYLLEPQIYRLDDLREQMVQQMEYRLQREKQRLDHLQSSLEGQSPLALLDRGYVYATDQNGNPLRDSSELSEEQMIFLRLSKGSATAQIKEIDP